MKKFYLFVFAVLFLVNTVSNATIRYVTTSGAGNNDGLSWVNAYSGNQLQVAINASSPGDQVWVASGTYLPTTEVGGTGSRFRAFQMKEGVEIYGGFVGTEASNYDLNLRDFSTNETILSGDLDGDDVVTGSGATLTITYNDENSCHVLYHPDGLGLSTTAVLDGFTVKGGNANVSESDLYGGGMYNKNNHPTFQNCLFSHNHAYLGGGGIWNEKSNPIFIHCVIESNTTLLWSAGIVNYDNSSPGFSDCSFKNNTAYYTTASNGGGIGNYNYCNPTITNCNFINNLAFKGAGIYNMTYCNPIITNCNFEFNENYSSSASKGGAVCNYEFCDATIKYCNFQNNLTELGGAIQNYYSNPTIFECSFSNNSASYGGAIHNMNSNPIIENCEIIGNSAYYEGGGIYNLESHPSIDICYIENNTAGNNGGGIFNQSCSPTIMNSEFNSNKSNYANGGGISNVSSSNPDISNCNFIGNIAGGGGGISNEGSCNPTITSCYFENNSAGNAGGGIRNDGSSIAIISSCTFLTNSAFYNGGGICNVYSSNSVITNCSLIENEAQYGAGIWNYSANPEINNCTIEKNIANYYGGGIYNQNNSSSIITNCTLIENVADNGAGIWNNASDPVIDYCRLNNNRANQYGGGIYNQTCSPTITNSEFNSNLASNSANGGGICNVSGANPKITACNFIGNIAGGGGGISNEGSCNPTITSCYFENNYAGNAGGGILNSDFSNAVITSCTFKTNSAFYNGGGICNVYGSDANVTNCTIYDNRAGYGAGIWNYSSNPMINNCTISSNISSDGGGGVYNAETVNIIINNSIIWGNFAQNGTQINHTGDGSTVLSYSCFPDGANDILGTFTESYCIHTDPLLGPLQDNGGPTKTCALSSGSPCINAGTLTDAPITDQRGKPRIGKVDIGAYECQGAPVPENLVLHLDPTEIFANGPDPDPDPTEVESFFDIWYDHTTPKENAEQFDVNKQAFYTVANGFGSGRPGVLFTADQTATGYGNSDIMTIDWSKDITTDKEDKWNPSKAAKTLFVVFKTGADVTGDNHPYYCDGRQTLLEAGGPLSGYNIYIQNSKLCFGMWNRFEQKFFMYDPPNSENGIYPLSPESIYVAQLQYDGTNFRSALVKQGISSIALSQPLPFAGISRDMSDNSAIGGASRTRYHDYSTGETYSDHFSGVLGDILLYNKALSQAEAQAVYDFLAGRYGLGDIDFISPKQVAEDWRVYEYLEQSEENRLSQSYPNPFTGETNFAVFLKEGSNVAITLHDIRGTLIHTIYSGELGKGLHNFMIDGTSLAQGVYTYRILGANFSEAAKAVLIK